MAKNLVFIFIVVLFFSAVNCQDCTGKGPNPSDLIESGKATILRNTDLQSRHQCYTFPLKYTPPDNKFEIILSNLHLIQAHLTFQHLTIKMDTITCLEEEVPTNKDLLLLQLEKIKLGQKFR